MKRSIALLSLVAGVSLGLAMNSLAQQYDISWYKIAGGGGTSTGGVYTVSGTIGQHDAGTLSGGSYSLTGGFWGIIAAIQTPGSPFLSITVTNHNAVLAWPTTAIGFKLQQDASTGNTNWTAVNTNTFPVVVVGSSNTVTIPVSGGNQFFRLSNP
jgi:hypothetical protein